MDPKPRIARVERRPEQATSIRTSPAVIDGTAAMATMTSNKYTAHRSIVRRNHDDDGPAGPEASVVGR